MSKVATKLFRDPEEAKRAISELKAKGFKVGEIGVLTSEKRGKELGSDIKPTSDASKLTAMGVPEETIDYYKFSIESGGIVISVEADEKRVAQAQALLRAATLEKRTSCRTSPGFEAASRMSATNPMDAPMSGDFRRY